MPFSLGYTGFRLPLVAGTLALLAAAPGIGQTLLGGRGSTVRLFGTDMAVLEMGEARKDLPCKVDPTLKAQVGFDLKFHAGFDITVPLRELAGSENLLTIIFRVTPSAEPSNPTYFIQRLRVPEIEEDAKGEAAWYGGFDLGEGNYKVDWLMRDRSERVCSNFWEVEAALPNKDSQMSLVLNASAVNPSDNESFKDEPPVERTSNAAPVNVKILLNYAPQVAHSSVMRPIDTTALVSILRSIVRQPQVGKFSVVAFSMADQKVLYRQENEDRINFPSLGEALGKVKLGTVDLSKLAQKNSETIFLTDLIQKELASSPTDAVIFAGPKVMLDHNVEQGDLKEVGSIDFPVFYLNYNLYPNAVPWKDSISHAVKFFKGQEYTISKPRDLWFATSEVVSRIVKSRNIKIAQNAGDQ